MHPGYKEAVERYLAGLPLPAEPRRLYDPVRYVLRGGGKRLRPVLTLMTAGAYGVAPDEALPAAAALEIFHNFTLLHDDIMDRAALRRGRPTVHRKWDENTAILSGDAMVYVAQQQLEHYPPALYKDLQSLFNRTALEICEGQQRDMDFEARDTVSMDEYLEMIRQKTAVLLATAMQYGALLAGRPVAEQETWYRAGIALGLAFQIADDYLDTFGDESFGKAIGGDIREGKKTWLFVRMLDLLKDPARRQAFVERYNRPDKTTDDIRAIIRQMQAAGIPALAREAVEFHTRAFLRHLQETGLDASRLKEFEALAQKLRERNV